MTNSTLPGHAHPSDTDGIKAADEIIILVLGAVVCVTFALGLVSQLCETPILFCRPRQYWDEDYEDEYYGFGEFNAVNVMSDLEASTCTAQLPLRSAVRSATRYGSITPHIMDINGVTKMVLVVDTATPPGEGALDAYAEWFVTWRRRLEAYREQRLSDERAPLLGAWS